MSEFLTSDKTLIDNPVYIKIRDALYLLIDSGFTVKYAGRCVDASRMVMAILAQHDIKSHMQECCALLTQEKDKIKQLYAIGYYHVVDPGEIATHYVTVTETEPSFFIDISIEKYLMDGQKIVLERAENEMILGNYSYQHFKLTYIRK